MVSRWKHVIEIENKMFILDCDWFGGTFLCDYGEYKRVVYTDVKSSVG
jgi:hypothetical protein